MPPRRVDWLNDKTIPQQKTIVRRYPAPQPQQQSGGGLYKQASAPVGTFAGSSVQGEYDPAVDSNPATINPIQKPANYQEPTQNVGTFVNPNPQQLPKESTPSQQGQYDYGVDPFIEAAAKTAQAYSAPAQTTPAATGGSIQKSAVSPTYTFTAPKPLNVGPITQPTSIEKPTVSPQIQSDQSTIARSPIGSVVPPKTTTAATTAPVGTLATENVRTGLQNLKDQMAGMTDADKRILNYMLANTDANNAANIQVLSNAIGNSSLSETGKIMAMAGLNRDASIARSGVSQQFAQDAAARAAAATRDAISTGQQVRTYEDVTLPQAEQQRRLNEQTISQNEKTLATQDLTARQALSQSINDRISLLKANNKITPEQIAQDSELNRLVKEFYGNNATPEQIVGELSTRLTAWNATNVSTAQSNVQAAINDAIDLGQNAATVIGNENNRMAMSAVLEGELGRAATDQEITDRLELLYNRANRKEYEIVVDDLIDSGTFDEYIERDESGNVVEKVPGVLDDLKRMTKDLFTKQLIDPTTGKIKADAVFDWPDEDPQTMFKYRDWNGNDAITSASSIQPVLVDGKAYTDANGMAVTNAAATEAWNKVPEATKDLWYADAMDEAGNLDTGKLIARLFPKTTNADGVQVAMLNSEEFGEKLISDEDFSDKWMSIATDNLFVDSTPLTDQFKKDNPEYAGLTTAADVDGGFLYYDENGVQRISDDPQLLANIYYQISQKYMKSGEPMPPENFSHYWRDGGKDWRIASDGTIKNLEGGAGSAAAIDKAAIAKTLEGFKPASAGASASTYSPEVLKNISSQWEDVPENIKATGFSESIPMLRFASDSRWHVTEDFNMKYVKDNIGKLYKADNGRIYEIAGIVGPDEKQKTGGVAMRDLETGQVVTLTNRGGSKNAASRPLTGEAYK